MERFGKIWHKELDSRWSLRNIFYRLDWRNKKIYDVSKWLHKQIDDPKANVFIKAQEFRAMALEPDVLAVEILKWVALNVKYTPDTKHPNKALRTIEYWQRSDETLDYMKGDCEDGAILVFVLARLAGIPANQIRIHTGNVKLGGHCWVEYRADFDGQRYLLDWCYWPDFRTIPLRKRRDQDKRYVRDWWSVTDVRGYGKFRLTPWR